MVLGPICIFYDGRCCVCMDRIDALGVAEWVRDERIGSFDGVPTIIHDLLTHPDVKQEDLACLTEPIMGGADSPPEVVRLFRERFGGEVIIGYGMTEAPTAVSWSDGEVPPGPGLCGKPVPQVEIEIRDEAGNVLPPGEVGEICVRPARHGEFAGVYTPMLGYWNNPKATAEALAAGVFHTGDLGFFADDGNLYIRGRRNELILRGGANIYPAEVERILQQHPAVSAAAVLGLPDERLGQRVVAVVQLEPGHEECEEALRSHTQGQLARYKVPDVIRFADEMPRNAMNKIVKKKLLSLFE
jgi:acyl-CoA synthetase (AMP-forming)/AMP-acid ligase II